MGEPLSPEASKKFAMENGVEVGDEEASCLQDKKRTGPLQHLRRRIMTDSKLGGRAKLAIAFLVLICIALFFAVIIMAVTGPRERTDVCKTSSCLNAAAQVVGKMSADAEPCRDVEMWACGKWLEDNAHTLPDRAEWSSAAEMKQTAAQRFNNIMSTSYTMKTEGPNTINWKMSALFDACMNGNLIESEHTLHMRKIINELGGWHVMGDWVFQTFDGSNTLELLHKRYGAEPFFSVKVVNLPEGNAPHIMLEPSGFGLPDPSFYQAGSKSKAVSAYKRLLKDTVLLFGATSSNADTFANDILAYEGRLAELRREGNDTSIAKITLKALTTDAQWLPIKNILTALFPQAKFNNSTEILIKSPVYIKHLNSVLYGAARGLLNDYLLWQVAMLYLPYTTEFSTIWQTFQSAITGGESSSPRWETCSNFIYDVAPLAVTSLMEKKSATTQSDLIQTNAALEEIFATVKSALGHIITDSSRLTMTQKEYFVDRLTSLHIKVGLLGEVDDAYLQEYHSKFFIQKGSFFSNVGFGFDFKRELLQKAFVDPEFNRKRSLLEALSGMSIRYDTLSHTIAIPRVLTETTNYYAHYPRSVQYGRIAVPMAFEMIKSLTANSDLQTEINLINETQHCIARILESMGSKNISLTPSAITGALHITAVEVAAKALNQYSSDDIVTQNTRGVRMPGLVNYDEMQSFALVYTQNMCAMTSPEQRTLNLLKGQLDGEILTKLTWSQMKEFSKAFNCKRHPECTSLF